MKSKTKKVIFVLLVIIAFIFAGIWIKQQFFTVGSFQEDVSDRIFDYVASYCCVTILFISLGKAGDMLFSKTKMIEGTIQEKRMESGTLRLLNSGNNVLIPLRTSSTYYFVVNDIEIEVDGDTYHHFKKGNYVKITYKDGLFSTIANDVESLSHSK